MNASSASPTTRTTAPSKSTLTTQSTFFLLDLCPTHRMLYRYSNGDIAHGGYSNAIRVHERFVFALPDSLTDENVASMLCAGLTVWAPLRKFNVGPGSKVAVAGIGGLGHYAVQFASALGAEVTAISHQADKEVSPIYYNSSSMILTVCEGRRASDGSKALYQHDVRGLCLVSRRLLRPDPLHHRRRSRELLHFSLSTSLTYGYRDFLSRTSSRCSPSMVVSTPVVYPTTPSLLSTPWISPVTQLVSPSLTSEARKKRTRCSSSLRSTKSVSLPLSTSLVHGLMRE